MFGIGGSEFLIIAVIVVMLFGPDKLPKLARTIGRFMSEFKRYQAMMESTLRAEMYLTEEPVDRFKKAGEHQDKLRAEREAAAAEAGEASDESAEPTESDVPEGEDAGVTVGEHTDHAAEAEPIIRGSISETDGLETDADGNVIVRAEDTGWTPGTSAAPGTEQAGETGEETELQP